ncbi:MAG: hypothetical protein H8E66_16610 [Planctomycetes bacterium]|nr:hypothetical protein [Planctomycetota bacterium]
MTNITDGVINLLQCPLTKQRLVAVEAKVLDHVNDKIRHSELTNRLGAIVSDVLDDGLVNASGAWLYPVRDSMVCLLTDEAIPLDEFATVDQEDIA